MPRRELAALLPAVAQLFTFSSPLAVRHGLAVMCRVPSARVKPLLAPLSAPLRAAFEMYSPMGLMHEDGQDEPPSVHRGAAGVMALSDWLARVYLARLLCKIIFAGVVSGPQKQFLWRVLVRLAFSPREKPHVRHLQNKCCIFSSRLVYASLQLSMPHVSQSCGVCDVLGRQWCMHGHCWG